MGRAYLFSGFPGAGKSTLAEKIASKTNTIIINADALGHMLKGQYKYYSKPEAFACLRGFVGDVVFQMAKEAIERDMDFIIDETLLTRAAREKWVDYISMRDPTYDIYIVEFPVHSLEWHLERRMRNSKGVSKAMWKKILKRMQEKYEPVDPALSNYKVCKSSDIKVVKGQVIIK